MNKQIQIPQWVTALIGFAVIGGTFLFLTQQAPRSRSTTPSGCVSASGRLYTGVKLYRDSACSGSPVFTVLGGNPGNSHVKLQAPDSDPEWKQRNVVTSHFYVNAADPAIASGQWLEYKN